MDILVCFILIVVIIGIYSFYYVFNRYNNKVISITRFKKLLFYKKRRL
jgi:hypothetical protein